MNRFLLLFIPRRVAGGSLQMTRTMGLLLLFTLAFYSCRKSEDTEPEPRLVSVTFAGEYKKADIVAQAAGLMGSSAATIGNLLRYDVKCYKVVYKTTTTDGREITASGALALPSGGQKAPLVSIQHGTLFTVSDAPSNFKPGTESMLSLFMASSGFLAGMPDYVGYGDSHNELHPYEHAAGLAVPIADFLLAVKEYFKKEGTAWNNDLLIAGYSAGGYATMAAQKLIEETYSREFNLKASSCGAGAYNKSLLLDKFVNEPTAGEANHNSSYIWVMLTYNRIYKLNRPVSYYFREPYASQIEEEGYRVSLSGSFNSLLNPDFIASYKAGKESALVEAFRENDLVNWKTGVTTLLVHGNADTYVPYVNSTTALEGMKKAGSARVSLETVEGGTHESSVQDFIFKTYLLFAANLTN
ncbi:alpha/beta hydrolase family protein [Leadbetterella sp. DM7]|uniref:alpha/beta hydrolase family protein n=1 Tax=Leadbetterella sp. DM7 TaxID=3235085 RepID=UPI00349E8392